MFKQSSIFVDPPKTELRTVQILYNNLEENVELVCRVKCANPQIYTYIWSDGITTISQTLSTNANSISYLYKINAQSFDDTFTITCTITNGINNTNSLAESQTVFEIIHSSKITPNRPPGSKDIFC